MGKELLTGLTVRCQTESAIISLVCPCFHQSLFVICLFAILVISVSRAGFWFSLKQFLVIAQLLLTNELTRAVLIVCLFG